MFSQKKVLVSLGSAALIGLAVAGGATAFAQTNQAPGNVMFFRGEDNMIQKLAQKLGIEESKVQAAFDEIHQENASMHQQKMNERLDALVAEGKINESQKQAIIAKLEEMKINFNPETFKNMTPEQHHEALEQKKTELEDWAKSQGIDLSILPFQKFEMRVDGEGGGMMKMKGWHGWMGSPSASPNSNQ